VVQGCWLIQTSPSHGRLPSLLLHAAYQGDPSPTRSRGTPQGRVSRVSPGAGDGTHPARLWMLEMPVSCCPGPKGQIPAKSHGGPGQETEGPPAASCAAAGRAPGKTHQLRDAPAAYSHLCFSWISHRC